jgi:CDP-diacylglycerol--glycerol-3-phosphate 3-phosphatidyltransferase
MEPYVRSRAGFIINPFVKLFRALHITPDMLTIAGFLLNCVAGLLIARGYIVWGGVVMTCLAMPLDGLDGPLARSTGKQSKWGAFLDSTLDRYAEAALLVGLAWYFQSQNDHWSVIGSMLALLGSLMVSYARAKAESLGLHGEVGLFSRFGRFLTLVAGLFLFVVTPLSIVIMVWALAILSNITAIQRMMHVAQNT